MKTQIFDHVEAYNRLPIILIQDESGHRFKNNFRYHSGFICLPGKAHRIIMIWP